jgi:hypothetical protein
LDIIETRGDADWFSFTTATGNKSLSINPARQALIKDGFGNNSNDSRSLLAGRSPNLDIAASPYYGTNGTPIPRSNPLDRLPTSFHLNLSAGRGQQGIQGGSPGSGD